MVSTFHGLEVGKRGLMVGQASIATTGHNIANANTKGYSRQQVNSTTSPSLDVWTSGVVNPGQLGTGVSLDSITRVRDKFLDEKYRDQSAKLGEASVKQETLDQLETIINEPSETGLNSSMDQLWGAWQDLANEPDSLSAKAVVKERAQAFVDTAKSMNESLTNLKVDLETLQSEKMKEAEGYLQQIAALNDSIKRNGVLSNDLLDKRDLAVEELSKIVDINVNETNGVYNITFKSSGINYKAGSNNTEIEITDKNNVGSGELSGVIQSIETVGEYQDSLKDVVKEFVMANEMEQLNPTDPINPTPSSRNLFSVDSNWTIDSLEVNSAVKGDSQIIRVLKDGMEDNYKDASKKYRALVSELGAESQTAIRNVANYEATLQATDSRRQSVTGVSLDEEMANLIKYQHSYSAAARMISTTDQMLDTIINRMAAR
ncbi:flagellar hook-associated protein FlgK [Paenisporosarcina sp. NPDC076898]|uniref:flagellar hook-associated protein FlgK n=1 Tax=unclassified Paenisporosarcina TaxID=2642018 RepID=UPI003D03610E